MTTQLTLRSVKGSPLTNDEMDTNWVNLRSTADSALTAANSANAAMPTATATTTGGIKVGSGLSIDGAGVLSASGSGGSYTLPAASSTTLGGIKVGSGLAIDGAGVVTTSTSTATATTLGSIKIGSGLSISQGVASVPGAVKAWVVFDGTTAPATITTSLNVSTVSRDAAGRYTINFASALPDANYAVMVCNGGQFAGINGCVYTSESGLTGTTPFNKTNTSVTIQYGDGTVGMNVGIGMVIVV